MDSRHDPSVSGLYHAISFQIAGIAVALLANSANFALILFADTNGHEIALCVPIIATALFTCVWVMQLFNHKLQTLRMQR